MSALSHRHICAHKPLCFLAHSNQHLLIDKGAGCGTLKNINSGLCVRDKDRLSSSGILFDILSTSLTTKNMEEGIVARVVSDKGFGFIKRDGQEKDLFFHSNELVNTSFNDIREGDKVTFEVADSPKGPNAIKVSKI